MEKGGLLLAKCFSTEGLVNTLMSVYLNESVREITMKKGLSWKSLIWLGLVILSLCFYQGNCRVVTVGSPQELIDLFKRGKTVNDNIQLTSNLDFSASSLTLPLGASDDGTCVDFSGVIQGNGHSIKGLKMDNKNNEGYKHAGLFCSLKDATVENLVIDSSCSFTGYSVGALSVSVDGELTVKHITSNAPVNGTWIVGGFIGYLHCSEQQTVISFVGCVNNGVVSGSYYVGGFVGYISRITNMAIRISNSVNNGIVTGDEYAGGFIGCISSFSDSVTLSIMNCANKGSILSKQGMACGLVCVDTEDGIYVKTIIKNSINKGSIKAGKNGYGITNSITEARNVVSMGGVTGSSGSYTFWDASTDVELLYGLNHRCFNCGDYATLFQHKRTTGFYEVVGSGNHVDDLLNHESVKQHFCMVWTKELELVYSETEHCGSLSSTTLQALSPTAILFALLVCFFELLRQF